MDIKTIVHVIERIFTPDKPPYVAENGNWMQFNPDIKRWVDTGILADISKVKGVPNGVATLNGSGKIPVEQVPTLPSADTLRTINLPPTTGRYSTVVVLPVDFSKPGEVPITVLQPTSYTSTRAALRFDFSNLAYGVKKRVMLDIRQNGYLYVCACENKTAAAGTTALTCDCLEPSKIISLGGEAAGLDPYGFMVTTDLVNSARQGNIGAVAKALRLALSQLIAFGDNGSDGPKNDGYVIRNGAAMYVMQESLMAFYGLTPPYTPRGATGGTPVERDKYPSRVVLTVDFEVLRSVTLIRLTAYASRVSNPNS